MLNSMGDLFSQLSEESSISILTCAPGDELYSIFGHTALRVKDPSKEIDYIFNYGTFNFNTPNFYLKFIRGQLNYMLSVSTFEHFMYEYKSSRRNVWEQELELTMREKNVLFQSLLINAQPENKYYHYHFFFDNCATRVRDKAVEFIDTGVDFGGLTLPESFSFRDAISYYLKEKPWTKLGLDLILGQPTDDILNDISIQFLPDYLMWQFEKAIIKSNNSPLVKETIIIAEFEATKASRNVPPVFYLSIFSIALLILSFIEYKYAISFKWIDLLIFITTTLMGLLICFLWFFTSHTVTGPNWHILWINPFHLMLIFSLFKKTSKLQRISNYIIAAGITLMIPGLFLFPQYIPISLLPIFIALAIRIVFFTTHKIK